MPWFVSGVALDEESRSVSVRVELPGDASLACPVCFGLCPGYDMRDERRWRHLDSCGFKTYLLAAVPRVKCPEHGVLTIGVPWGESHSRFTLDFERFAIQVLKAVKSQVRAARLLNLSWDQVHEIMGRAVKRGLSRRKAVKMTHLSVDEKGFQSQRRYATVLTDIQGSRVLDVCEERTAEAAQGLILSTLSQDQLESVRSVTMDMWDGFIKASKAALPDADIVFDRFHIAKYLNDAVDHTRIDEHNKLKRQGDLRLKGSKFFWVSRQENLKDKQIELYGALKDANLETAKAWALKENFREFFALQTPEEGEDFFGAWSKDVAAAQNKHLAKVAKMLNRYFFGLSNYLKHRQTNSAAEGTNSLIQEVKFAARGFRTFSGFRIAVLFFLGKMSLYPQESQ
jgi:transposase